MAAKCSGICLLTELAEGASVPLSDVNRLSDAILCLGFPFEPSFHTASVVSGQCQHYNASMAIIIRNVTECPLCGEVLRDGDEVVATSHFLHSGPLSRYSDAGMHRKCFIAWPNAGAFRSAFNDAGRTWPGGPRQMLTDGTIVEMAPDQLPQQHEAVPRMTIGVLGSPEDRVQLLAALGKRKG